jgi:hypothetical protein
MRKLPAVAQSHSRFNQARPSPKNQSQQFQKSFYHSYPIEKAIFSPPNHPPQPTSRERIS